LKTLVNLKRWDKYTDQGTKDGAAHVEANLKNLPHIGLNVREYLFFMVLKLYASLSLVVKK